MEACFFGMLFFAFLIYETVKIFQKSGNTQPQRNYSVYTRQMSSEEEDQKYADRIIILDAAEDGYFFPEGEKVFEDKEDEENEE